jgi:hypothetical protein
MFRIMVNIYIFQSVILLVLVLQVYQDERPNCVVP